MSKYLWLCVEADKYELPLYVADTAKELAEKLGTTKHNVEVSAFFGNSGTMSGRRFLKIPKEKEIEE